MDQLISDELSFRHLPELSDTSISFQIPTGNSSHLLADDDDDFLKGAAEDSLSTPIPHREPLTLRELTPSRKNKFPRARQPSPLRRELTPPPPHVPLRRSPRRTNRFPQAIEIEPPLTPSKFETLKAQVETLRGNELGDLLHAQESSLLSPVHQSSPPPGSHECESVDESMISVDGAAERLLMYSNLYNTQRSMPVVAPPTAPAPKVDTVSAPLRPSTPPLPSRSTENLTLEELTPRRQSRTVPAPQPSPMRPASKRPIAEDMERTKKAKPSPTGENKPLFKAVAESKPQTKVASRPKTTQGIVVTKLLPRVVPDVSDAESTVEDARHATKKLLPEKRHVLTAASKPPPAAPLKKGIVESKRPPIVDDKLKAPVGEDPQPSTSKPAPVQASDTLSIGEQTKGSQHPAKPLAERKAKQLPPVPPSPCRPSTKRPPSAAASIEDERARKKKPVTMEPMNPAPVRKRERAGTIVSRQLAPKSSSTAAEKNGPKAKPTSAARVPSSSKPVVVGKSRPTSKPPAPPAEQPAPPAPTTFPLSNTTSSSGMEEPSTVDITPSSPRLPSSSAVEIPTSPEEAPRPDLPDDPMTPTAVESKAAATSAAVEHGAEAAPTVIDREAEPAPPVVTDEVGVPAAGPSRPSRVKVVPTKPKAALPTRAVVHAKAPLRSKPVLRPGPTARRPKDKEVKASSRPLKVSRDRKPSSQRPLKAGEDPKKEMKASGITSQPFTFQLDARMDRQPFQAQSRSASASTSQAASTSHAPLKYSTLNPTRKENFHPTVPHSPAFQLKTRLRARAEFDAGVRQRDGQKEREREEARLERDREEEKAVLEMRKKMIPKAHEVPGWYEERKKLGKSVVGEEE